MVSRTGSIAAALTLAVALALAGSAMAADEASPRAIRQQIDAVEKLLETGQPDAAAAALAQGIAGLEAMRAGPAPQSAFKLLADRAGKARAKLEQAGIDVSGLVLPVLGGAPAPAAAPARRPAAAGVSFAREVAPFLVATCGRCHVSGRKGDFQMASYAQLMSSAKVSPGMGSMSELVEVMLSGEMPPGGGKVSPDQVGMMIRWIDAGAGCDADPNADLAALARAAAAPPPGAAPEEAAAPAPLEPGAVAFSSAVAPILLDQCGNCHGDRDPEANLRLTSLESLLKGGRSGPAAQPGKGNASLLVRKLRGMDIEGQRMPLGKPPLTAEQIATIATWIDQGARIDLLSPKAPLETVVAAGRARRLSHEELTKLRLAAAESLWRRFIPDEPPAVELRPGFCLVGNLPEARLEELAAEADEVAARVRAELGTGDGPLLKGGVILYVFRKSYDYSELWQVVLGLDRPKGVTAHAGVAGDVVYGALVLPTGAEEAEDTRLLLAEQLTAAALTGRGLPAWFCRGVGRAAASRIAPKAGLVQAWKRDTGAAVKQLGSATDYFAGRSDPAAAALAGGGFLGSLMGTGKLARLMAAVDGGTSFDAAFQQVFRSTPEQAFMAWAAKQGGR